jgi:deoxyribose-phosphate aldolase
MENLNQYIDHTLLKADAKPADIAKLVEEAKKYNFHSVCVNSSYVALVRSLDKQIMITSVVGFPLGAMSTRAKVFEAKAAVEDGADEIDMVINIGRLKAKDYDYVKEEIRQIRKEIPQGILTVIIETALLTDDEKKKACKIALEAEADFVKTSTGFSKRGATVEDIKLMRKILKNKLKIKAAGSIKTKKDALDMIKAGASRLGCSASTQIVS